MALIGLTTSAIGVRCAARLMEESASAYRFSVFTRLSAPLGCTTTGEEA